MMIRNHIYIIFLVFAFQFKVGAQNIGMTIISEDVIVLHPLIADNMEMIREVGGNVVAVRTDDGILVSDSFNSPENGRKARNLIENHFPGIPVKYLINSHHHADHTRGNQIFRDICIMGHSRIKKYMLDDYNRLLEKYGNYQEKIDQLKNRLIELNPSQGVNTDSVKNELIYWEEVKTFIGTYSPTPPSNHIQSDTSLKLGGKTFEILYFGNAHTDNDLVILDQEDKVLIMSDLLCYRKCYVLNKNSDPKNWIALLQTLINRSDGYNYVIPGHGGIIMDVNALKEQQDYLKEMCTLIKHGRENNFTVDQVKQDPGLKKFENYLDYERIGLEIDTMWKLPL